MPLKNNVYGLCFNIIIGSFFQERICGPSLIKKRTENVVFLPQSKVHDPLV